MRRLGDYELLEELGAGAMGAVYLARHVGTGARYALKTLRAPDPGLLARFQVEGEGQARVDHPQVVRVHSLAQERGTWFLVMELLEGGSLAQRLESGLSSPEQARDWVQGLARAVEHAHQRGVLHRDLKPSNVVFRGEVPVLVDFGLAKLADRRSLTEPGTLLGTPAYMAPEQADSTRGALGPATDVYGLGALLYHCLTGRAPFAASSVLKILEQVLELPPTPPRSLNPQVPPGLEAVCLRCLEKEPAARFRSAAELADALEQAGHEPATAGPGRTAALAAGAVLGVAALGAGVAWLTGAPRGPVAAAPSPVSPAPSSPPPTSPPPPSPAGATEAPGVPTAPPALPEASAQVQVWMTEARRLTQTEPRKIGKLEALLRQILERSPLNRLSPEAACRLGNLLCTCLDERLRQVDEGLVWWQRGVLWGGADAAISLAATTLPTGISSQADVIWPLRQPEELEVSLDYLALAHAWSDAQTNYASMAEELVRQLADRGRKLPPPEEAYARVWARTPELLAQPILPSLPDLAYQAPATDEQRQLLDRAEAVRSRDPAQAVTLLRRLLDERAPSRAYPEACARLIALLYQAPKQSEPGLLLQTLQRGTLAGDGASAKRVAYVYLESPEQLVFAAPELGQTPDDDLAWACCVLAEAWGDLDVRVRNVLQARGGSRPGAREAYRRAWRAFSGAR